MRIDMKMVVLGFGVMLLGCSNVAPGGGGSESVLVPNEEAPDGKREPGNPERSKPKEPKPAQPKRRADNDPVDPFGLQTLLRQPYEEFPKAIPKVEEIKISAPKKLSDKDDEFFRKLEGTWIGGSANDARTYFQFNRDRTWSGLLLCDKEKGGRTYFLLSGDFNIEDGKLHLTVEAAKTSGNYSSRGLEVQGFADHYVYSHFTSMGHLLVPMNLENDDTLVLFGEKRAETVLVRKK